MQTRCYQSPWCRAGTLLLVGVLVLGCASSEQVQEPGSGGGEETPAQEEPSGADASEPSGTVDREGRGPEPKKVLRLPEVRERIEEVAQEWLGVPYEWSGESKQGIDCSALVQTLFHEAFDRRLPRVTELQVQAGSTVTRPQLRAGDLVFFRPENQYNHVGLYLGEKTFIHASSSQGVTTAPIDTNYWRRYYWTARRVLSPSKVPDSLVSELVAYQYPDSTAQHRPSDTALEAEEGSSGDDSRDVQIAAVSDSSSIPSCADPNVQCSSRGQGAPQDSTLAPADTIERKGW